mmetsp:Transcript_8406/g.9496  ORF Transcript_8406/g.9496 Transcript_8406/m.9496 type:complete len:154 (+) Transcript_8406:68-529(+)
MSRDMAWKQRVLQEDKQLLAKVIEARRKLADNVIATTPEIPHLPEAPTGGSRRFSVAAPVGSSVRSTCSSSSVSAPSACRSSTSTQLSHHGVSTVQGSMAISHLSVFSTRLEKLEHRLEEERKERRRVVDELAEIKQLLISQKLQQQKPPSRK